MQFFLRQFGQFGRLDAFRQMGFRLIQQMLPHPLGAPAQHKAAAPLDVFHKALLLQLRVSPGDRQHTDLQVLGQGPQGGQRLALAQFSRQDGRLDLLLNLLIDRNARYTG